jgi:NAD(P)H-dependent flavin oxidoreductase YrpB (nitropropane dioxygenase family)
MKNSLGPYPVIIQGGMGVNISGWKLARTVSMLGQQGTVSGTALEIVVGYMLAIGDPGEHIRRALSHFPFQNIVQSVLKNFFIEGGVKAGWRHPGIPVWTIAPSRKLIELTICANYAIVWLAKEGHDGIISINYLEKIAMPHIYAITGSMLAGVDVITMGAGMPNKIPAVINAVALGETASYMLPVIPLPTGKNITTYKMEFDSEQFFGQKLPPMDKPRFIPIISSNALANGLMRLIRRGELAPDDIYGFVIEEPTAGGHNAPPREKNTTSYGPKDQVDYAEMAKIGKPFWIGGSYGSPEKLVHAQSMGACGIQAGSIFALCEESGMDKILRERIRELGYTGELVVKTDFEISPTSFPLKVVQLKGTISESEIYEGRKRVCDKGVLVNLYEKADGSIGYRCPSEPTDIFLCKGGNLEDTIGSGCVCNGLLATGGVSNTGEIPMVTLGDDDSFLKHLMADKHGSYHASDAIEYLLRLK